MRLIAKGAEANIYLEGGRLIKHRIKKEYRVKELDLKLRRQRTKRESKLLDRSLRAGVLTPGVYDTDLNENKIVMEFIDGVMIRDVFANTGEKETIRLSRDIGANIAILHNSDIVHNDLTTSNMLKKDDGIYFIDFGLGMMSKRTEDKAMDLVVFKKALKPLHAKKFDLIWNAICEGYRNYGGREDVMKRAGGIEKRGRYFE
ncbi:MAG: Kae1-associated kinase Bud32 [Candidatus Altiarchaeales archaeon WOR_SM1_86-2]|nr:MAG: Kae1-associated kinase Bud32 [Candidatus Altiarchaeales archaeon WOR_SM1_86-2]